MKKVFIYFMLTLFPPFILPLAFANTAKHGLEKMQSGKGAEMGSGMGSGMMGNMVLYMGIHTLYIAAIVFVSRKLYFVFFKNNNNK